VGILKQAEVGVPVAELCRQAGISPHFSPGLSKEV